MRRVLLIRRIFLVCSLNILVERHLPSSTELPDNQQDHDMIARELLIKFQMSDRHPLSDLRKAYMKF